MGPNQILNLDIFNGVPIIVHLKILSSRKPSSRKKK
jgi:hypothetical protein